MMKQYLGIEDNYFSQVAADVGPDEIHKLLVFLCLKTREVIVTESTLYPGSEWVCGQTEWFIEQTKDRKEKPSLIMHDRDFKFTKGFTQTVKKGRDKDEPTAQRLA